MTDKDLRRMSRRELIEVIYELKKNEVKLKTRLEALERKVRDREIRIANAGSIAEAALSINNVLEAAQAAAEDYLRSIKAQNPSMEALLDSALEGIEDTADEEE